MTAQWERLPADRLGRLGGSARIAKAIASVPVALLMTFAGMIPSHADQTAALAKNFHAYMVTDTGRIK
jgi:hypothetical protein